MELYDYAIPVDERTPIGAQARHANSDDTHNPEVQMTLPGQNLPGGRDSSDEKVTLRQSGKGREATGSEGMQEYESVSPTLDAAPTVAPPYKRWVWSPEKYHGAREVIEDMEVLGETAPVPRWTCHEGFAGIGVAAMGIKAAGGTVTASFEKEPRARTLHSQHSGVVPRGKYGSFPNSELGPADVYVSAAPYYHDSENLEWRQQRQMMFQQLNLVREKQYKMAMFETVPKFQRLSNGEVMLRFVKQLESAGYRVCHRVLFGPDFGSVAATRKLVIVAIRADLVAKGGDFRFPAPTSKHHPLRSVLEDGYTRRHAVHQRLKLVRLRQPVQHNPQSLTLVGHVRVGQSWEKVYDSNGFACTPKAAGRGLSGTSGLYLIDGQVSGLTVREAANIQQVEEGVVLDPVESVARRQLASAAPVGMTQAMGLAFGNYLHRCGTATSARQHDPTPLPVRQQAQDRGAGLHSTVAMAVHKANMARWSAEAATAKSEELLSGLKVCPRLFQMDAQQLDKLRQSVKTLHWRSWLRLQRQAGLRAVKRMKQAGCSAKEECRAVKVVEEALRSEYQRGMGEAGRIQLLFWNWDDFISDEVRDDVTLQFITPPIPFRGDNYESADCEKVWKEFDRMLDLGYIEGPYDEDSEEIFVVHSIAAVEKKPPNQHKKRIVVDMTRSQLNAAMLPPRFILPTVESIAEESYPHCHYATMDMKDGFYISQIHEKSRKYLGVRNPSDGLLYRYKRSPMGLGTSPFTFSRKVAYVVQELMSYPEFKPAKMVVNDTNPWMPRIYGVTASGTPVCTIKAYVDDFCLIGPTSEAVQAAYSRVVWLLESRFGMRICAEKTKFGQKVKFLGLELDSVTDDQVSITLPSDRRARCLSVVSDFIKRHRRSGLVNRRELAQVCGELMFAARAVRAGRTFLKRLYSCLYPEGSDKLSNTDWEAEVTVTPGGWRDLRWWQECLLVCECSVRLKTRSFALQRLVSDASNYGYGMGLVVPGKTCDDGTVLPSMQFGYGTWEGEVASYSSNDHELRTIAMSLRTCKEQLRGCVVHFMTDNTTCVKAVNSGVVSSRRADSKLMELVREIKLLEAEGDMVVECHHLRGKHMIVSGVDGISRAHTYLGQMSPNPAHHDTFTPMSWPQFELQGEIGQVANTYRTSGGTIDMSDPEDWTGVDLSGKDSYFHLRPRHAAMAFAWALDAQLRKPATTSFTFVLPMFGLRLWSKFRKHFRSKRRFKLEVPGLGMVTHEVLRYSAGDGLLGKSPQVPAEVVAEPNDLSITHPQSC